MHEASPRIPPGRLRSAQNGFARNEGVPASRPAVLERGGATLSTDPGLGYSLRVALPGRGSTNDGRGSPRGRIHGEETVDPAQEKRGGSPPPGGVVGNDRGMRGPRQ